MSQTATGPLAVEQPSEREPGSALARFVVTPAFALRRRWHLVAFVVFFLVTCVIFAPVLHGKTLSEVSTYQVWAYPWAGSKTATYGSGPPIMHWDQLDSFYPWQVYMSRVLHAHKLPLWNPFEFGGIPFFANAQNGVLYPPRLFLSLTVSPVRVHDLLALSHMLGAGITMYGMLGYFRRSWLASVLGGCAWMTSSFLLAWLALEHFLVIAVWLPVAFALVDLCIRRRSIPGTVALTFTLTLLFLGGNALFVELSFLTIAAFAAVTILSEVRRERQAGSPHPYRPLWWGTAAMTGAWAGMVGLVAIELLPNLELLAHTARAGLSYAGSAGYELPPALLRDIFLPPELSSYPDPLHSVYHVALFVGTPTALFAVVALFLRGLVPAFLRALAVVVILIMLRTPLNHLLYAVIPGFDSIKPLARVSFLLCFAVAALAAYGLDRSIRFVLARWRSPTAITSLVAIACACIAVVVWQAKDLAREDLRTQDPAPSAMYPGTPLTDHLASLGSPRILPTSRMLRGSTAMVSQVQSAIGYESLIPRRVARFWEVVQGESVAQASTSALNSAYYPLFTTDNVRYDLLARAGVSYVAAIPGEKLPARGSKALHGIAPPTLEYNDTDGLLFKLAGATGLATVVHSCRTAPNELAALRTFTDDRYPAASTLLLEQPVSSLSRFCNGAPSRRESASLVSDGSNGYLAHATLRAPGMLLIRVNAYPGWHATVDGKATPLVAADYMYQAVPLTAGTHEVKLTFAPRSLRVGAAISLATLLVLLGTMAWSLTRNRRRTPTGVEPLGIS